MIGTRLYRLRGFRQSFVSDMDICKRFLRSFAATWLVLALIVLSPMWVFAQGMGDYIYCSPGWGPGGDKSWFGHAAIYVGPQYDQNGKFLGDVVENRPAGIRFTTMETLRSIYGSVRTASVPTVSGAVRATAARWAGDVARAIGLGKYVYWYSESFDFWSRNCVHTFQHFYLDVGASTEDVGDPQWLTHPGRLYDNFRRGQPGGCWWCGLFSILGVGTAASGGIESRPLWLGQDGIAQTYLTKQVSPQMVTSSIDLLEQFLPSQGPRSEVAQRVAPRDVIGGSNAVSTAGMDYIDNATGQISAAIFAAETVNSVYEHDYAVCTRVQGYEIYDLLAFPFGLCWWWVVSVAKPSAGYAEVVIPLTVRLSGSSAIIDSRYLVEYYSSPISGTVLNYQIRATSLADAMFFLESILNNVAQAYAIVYANLSEPPQPTVFARTATYRNPNIHLVVENQGHAGTVRFSGPTWSEPHRSTEKFVEFTINIPKGQSEVDLAVGPIHDAVIYIESDGFLDKVYVASGYWFAWDDSSGGGTSQVSLRTGELEHSEISGAAGWFVSPPLAEMTGYVTDAISWSHIGVGYALMQGREPVDLSNATSVAFWTKGDGKQYRVKLESASVADNDYHGAMFVAPADWTCVLIPLSEFRQEGWGQTVPWTAADIHTVSFVTVERPHNSVYLVVDRLSLIAELKTLSLSLDEGWNHSSICLDVADPGILSVLEPIDGLWGAVWAYDINSGWKKCVYDGPSSLNNLSTMECGKGYMIYMDSAATLRITGEEVTDTPIPLSRGWNLIGYNSLTPQPIENILSSLPDGTCIYTYNSGTWLRYVVGGPEPLNTLNLLEPGRGYWVWVKQDCMWHASP